MISHANPRTVLRSTDFSIRLIINSRSFFRTPAAFEIKSVFVGNLPWQVRADELAEVFSKVGEVKSSRILIHKPSGRSRGFGFVEMEAEDALKAIEALNGADVKGRPIRVGRADVHE
ncbi:hypothetical protein DFJ73DRAFT_817575 [Zopfochytrium polystomum]|nr:hypothetical protein DFJ73DRAFT_817575 [Zopfochytrium polystomum]